MASPSNAIRSILSAKDNEIQAPSWLPACCKPIFDWLFDTGRTPPYRKQVQMVLRSTKFEITLGLIVVANIFIVITEVDSYSLGEPAPHWTSVANTCFISIFSCEFLVRFFASRFLMFRDPFCILDTVLVGYEIANVVYLSKATPDATIFRIGRIAKVCRTVKLLNAVPELYLMIKGLLGAVKAVLWGSVLAILLIVLWSIVGVVWIHPLNKKLAQDYVAVGCARCPRAFESVFYSSLTLIQTIIAGDSWGQVALPIMENNPETMLYFYLVFATVALATMNMILAVIVDSAQMARQRSTEDIAKDKEKMREKAKEVFTSLCRDLDVNSDGRLSLGELEEAFRSKLEFANQLKLLEIHAEDMPLLFGLMDYDNSGAVSYEEFATELSRMQSNDTQSMMVSIRFYLTLIRRQLLEQGERTAQELADRIDEHEKMAEKNMLSVTEKAFAEENAHLTQLVQAVSDHAILSPHSRHTSRAPTWRSEDVLEPRSNLDTVTMKQDLGPRRLVPKAELKQVEQACRNSLETLTSLLTQVKDCIDAELDNDSCSDVLATIKKYALELASRTEVACLVESLEGHNEIRADFVLSTYHTYKTFRAQRKQSLAWWLFDGSHSVT